MARYMWCAVHVVGQLHVVEGTCSGHGVCSVRCMRCAVHVVGQVHVEEGVWAGTYWIELEKLRRK